jgi:pyruvate dehydrogenase E2 component (dihydrolipoamide acetyltransferase)
MAEFTMPSLGADMESGTLLEWLVKPGDTVHRGDVIAIVGTEKGDIEAEIFEDGVVKDLLVPEGKEVPVGTLLAVIRGEGEAAPEAAPVESAQQPVAAAPVPPPAAQLPGAQWVVAPVMDGGHRTRVSPLARKLAEELGIDLSQVQGSGEHGAISRADVEHAAAALKEGAKQATAAPSPTSKPLPEPLPEPAAEAQPAKPAESKAAGDLQSSMRRAIALAMARSNREIPHYYLQTRVDMSKALRWLEAENLQRPIKDRVLPAVIMLKAVAKALTHVPELNGYWLEDRLQPQEGIHIGFAIALRQGGLITPAIHHVDLKGIDELMAAMRDLIMRTRSGRLRSSEMTDSTITLTNLGDMGVESVYGVIYPPQVAIVGMGKTSDQVWVENGMLGVRPVLTATLAGDHRATDGRVGAQFLDVLSGYLQAPEKLWT